MELFAVYLSGFCRSPVCGQEQVRKEYGLRRKPSLKKLNQVDMKNVKVKIKSIFLTVVICVYYLQVKAQTADGNAGINQATQQVKSYFDTGCNLMYAIGAVVGIVGALKVYQKWNHGDHDTGKVAAAWFGSCVFLVIVATVLKSFFGI